MTRPPVRPGPAVRDTPRGFWQDLLVGVLVLVVLLVLVGGGAALGSALGAGTVVGALVGAGLFAVAAVVCLVTGTPDTPGTVSAPGPPARTPTRAARRPARP